MSNLNMTTDSLYFNELNLSKPNKNSLKNNPFVNIRKRIQKKSTKNENRSGMMQDLSSVSIGIRHSVCHSLLLFPLISTSFLFNLYMTLRS